jgi:Transposase IS4
VVDKIIAPLITARQHSFSTCFLPSQVIVVDESMVAYTGRDPLKQYIKGKPIPWGYKVWCVASDSYLLNFDVYKGKSKSKKDRITYHQVVSQLVQPYSHRGHLLFWTTCSSLWVSLTIWSALASERAAPFDHSGPAYPSTSRR